MNLLMLSGDVSVAQGRDGAFFQMLRRFSTYWDRIDILCPPGPGATSRVVHDNVYVHPSPRSKLFQPLFIHDRGRALMAERRYDLFTSHDFGFFYNGVGARRLHGATAVPYVSELHHVEGYPRAVTARERVYRAVAVPYIRWARGSAAAFRVVNSVEMPELLRRLGVPEEKILVLPALYVDFDVFKPMPDVQRQYDLIFVGRLMPNKGLFTLLDAACRLKTTHPGLRVGLLGRGPLEAELRRQVETLGLSDTVTLQTEPLAPAELARFYNSAAMLVCASTAEGGPRVTVEAMACRVPVVTTPVGMMRELIRHGENGLLFEWDAIALAAQARRLLDDAALRDELAEAGRLSVQGFQADRVIQRYAIGLHDLIARVKEV